MELKNDFQLANTRTKLAALEARYDALRDDSTEDAHVRDVTMRSLMRYINQFKEEIARYECRCASQNDSEERKAALNGIESDAQLENTRRKLHRLEELLKSKTHDQGEDEMRRTERISLKRLINQLKEEIARYEAHQPTR
jgi:hypothetical protein